MLAGKPFLASTEKNKESSQHFPKLNQRLMNMKSIRSNKEEQTASSEKTGCYIRALKSRALES